MSNIVAIIKSKQRYRGIDLKVIQKCILKTDLKKFYSLHKATKIEKIK